MNSTYYFNNILLLSTSYRLEYSNKMIKIFKQYNINNNEYDNIKYCSYVNSKMYIKPKLHF